MGKLDEDLNKRSVDDLKAEAVALRWAVNHIRQGHGFGNQIVREFYLYAMLPEFERRRSLVYLRGAYATEFDSKSVRSGWGYVMDISSRRNGIDQDLKEMDMVEAFGEVLRLRAKARKLLRTVPRRSERDYGVLFNGVPNGVLHLRRK